MQRVRRRLVAPTSGGDIERVKRIKANDGQLLAVGNQSGASLGVAAADFRLASNGVSLDNQTALLAAGGTTSVRTVLNTLQSSIRRDLHKAAFLASNSPGIQVFYRVEYKLHCTSTAVEPFAVA